MNITFFFIITNFITRIVSYDISAGCPTNVIFPLPPYDIKVYGSYNWQTSTKRTIVNEVTHHYRTTLKGNIIVASCYIFRAFESKVRDSISLSTRDGVRLACTRSDCDAGHIIPAIFGGNDSVTNLIPQFDNLNRGMWAQYEKAISRVPVGSVVVTIYEYEQNSYENTILSSIGAVPRYAFRHASFLRSYVYNDRLPNELLLCGTFLNDGRVPVGRYEELKVSLSSWNSHKPVGNFGRCDYLV